MGVKCYVQYWSCGLEVLKMLYQVDSVGRITLPKKIRNQLKIYTGDKMKMIIKDEKILLKKENELCFFCENLENEEIEKIKGINICQNCLVELIFLNIKIFVDKC